jgi:hypothetical protein
MRISAGVVEAQIAPLHHDIGHLVDWLPIGRVRPDSKSQLAAGSGHFEGLAKVASACWIWPAFVEQAFGIPKTAL